MNQNRRMRNHRLSRIRPWTRILPLCRLALLAVPIGAVADLAIVENGEARASIVIAENPPRMVTLAALELQYYAEKISGAKLPIVTEPDETRTVTIYVGQSAYTDALGVADEGLKYGAYRIFSNGDWLVLLGHDFDYEPPEPWARRHGDRPRAREAWDELTSEETDTAWGHPFGAFFRKQWTRRDRTTAMTERYGEANAKRWPGGDFSSGFWSDDEGGTLNAVYAWLETLGVRWYMPGELGEVVPEADSIALESFDETVKPDFDLRSWFWYNYTIFPLDDVLWARRLGLNGGSEVLGGGQYGIAHGHTRVHTRKAMQEAHPKYYALLGGRRDTEHRGHGTACYSSKGLEQETIAYARFMFDHYDWPKFSIWPGDGFRHCQCEQCAGKSASELVWEFTDRVARELYKSHPDRLVLGGAYAQYVQPPESIEQFSPNVVVDIANRGRPTFIVPEQWERYRETLEAWQARLAPRRIIRGDNNRYHMGEKVVFPIIQARAQAKDLQMLKGISIGEISEQSQRRRLLNPGANHLGLYTQARYLWDADQDIEALLKEYYELFYGPARDQMRAAFDFADEAYARAVGSPYVPIADRIELVEMLLKAREAVGDTIYGKRIQLILDELHPLEALRAQLEAAEARGDDVREFWTLMNFDQWQSEAAETIVMDGKLDERFWTVYPHGGSLRESRTGDRPRYRTRFMMRWHQNHLYVGIRCEDEEGGEPNIAATEDGDPAILEGDTVTLLLETQDLTHYEITVNPAGAVFDADRSEGGEGARWTAQAQAAAHVGNGYWSVELRIPVVDRHGDPLHKVAGRRPSLIYPWYFNVVRRRIREDRTELSAWEPTGREDLQDPLTFGRIYLRPGARRRKQLRAHGVRLGSRVIDE